MRLTSGIRTLFLILLAFVLFLLYMFLFGKTSSVVQQSEAIPEVLKGRQLAVNHCSSCHTFPEPSLLPKKLWSESVLPVMAPHLGVFRHKFTTYPTVNDPYLPPNYYSETPRVTISEWQEILNYYEVKAPEKLNRPRRQSKIVFGSFSFIPMSPEPISPELPLVTAVKFDTLNQQLYAADANMKKLLKFDRNLKLINRINAANPISDIQSMEMTDKNGFDHLLVQMN